MKAKAAASKPTVSDQLEKLPPELRSIVQAARRSVKAVAPKANEIACSGERPRSKSMMWKIVRYAVEDEPVVAIGVFSKHASMFFFRGSELDDGSGMLEGGGKKLRYFTLRSRDDAERAHVKRVLRKAFELVRD